MIVLDRLLNLDSLQWWLQFILVLLSIAGAVAIPMNFVMRKYKDSCINSNAVNFALEAIIKMTLDDIFHTSFKKESVTYQNLDHAELMYKAYMKLKIVSSEKDEPNGVYSKMDRLRHLKIIYDDEQPGKEVPA